MLTKLAVLLGLATSQVTGYAEVHDGDTLKIKNKDTTMWVRLQGVDAEELDEKNGLAAREALRALTRDVLVTCVLQGQSYHRRVGVCVTSGHVNVNEAIIKSGYALDCARYSHGAYRKLEPAGARERLRAKSYCSH